MIRASLTVLAALAVAVTLSAASSVAGTWTIKVEGTPHGTMIMGLTLEQEGAKVTGKFTSGHLADQTVSGELTGGDLTLETPGDGDSKVVLKGKLKQDGTLAGYLSSAVGDMTWTASRVEQKAGK